MKPGRPVPVSPYGVVERRMRECRIHEGGLLVRAYGRQWWRPGAYLDRASAFLDRSRDEALKRALPADCWCPVLLRGCGEGPLPFFRSPRPEAPLWQLWRLAEGLTRRYDMRPLVAFRRVLAWSPEQLEAELAMLLLAQASR